MKRPTTVDKSKSRLLPNRAAMKGLDKSQRTIRDYSKAVKLQDDDPMPVVLQPMRKP